MGKFITFEGGDGSGKSTIINNIADWLFDLGYKVLVTNDPGGTNLGVQIRKLLLTVDHKDMAKTTELLLYLASRAELVDKVIRPGLKEYDFVISDRFYDSTAVYQGCIRGWNNFKIDYSRNLLQLLHATFSGNLIPDYTFLLAVDPEIGLRRSLGDDKDEGKWEAEGLAIHKQINQEFMALAMAEPARFSIINANKYITRVLNDVQVDFITRLRVGGRDA